MPPKKIDAALRALLSAREVVYLKNQRAYRFFTTASNAFERAAFALEAEVSRRHKAEVGSAPLGIDKALRALFSTREQAYLEQWETRAIVNETAAALVKADDALSVELHKRRRPAPVGGA